MKKSRLKEIVLEAYIEALNEAPDDFYYIKVPRRDKAQLNAVQNTIETIYHPTRFTDITDNDGAGNVIMYFHKRDFDPGMIDDLRGDGVDIEGMTNLPSDIEERIIKESLYDLMYEEEEDEDPTPEEDPNPDAGPETVLEDATDTILAKFPTLKATIVKLQTEEFKEFVDSIDWVSPRPTTFRVNLKNGQHYILKWTGKGFQAQILGKRYDINKINDYQQAIDKLSELYKEGPMKGAGEEGGDFGDDTGGGGGGGGDFPGGEGGAEGGEDLGGEEGGETGGDEGGEDLSDEPIDFEAGEEG
jgi:hypothetical protein